jgi:hypothetical protein
MTDETRAEHIRRLADDGAGGLKDLSEIEQALEDEFANFGQIATDPATLPPDAGIRPSGYFTDPQDLQEYLETGGLVSTVNGENVPLSWVWLLQEYDDTLDEITYQVYIEEDS